MGELFFSPRSLARVVEHVEWEDVLVYYKDGTTNQEQFMRSLAMLYERWMREWSIPDFLAAINDVRGRDWASAFDRILSSMEARVFQLVGFWKGIWYGANPRGNRNIFGWQLDNVEPVSNEEYVRLSISRAFASFDVAVKQFYEEAR